MLTAPPAQPPQSGPKLAGVSLESLMVGFVCAGDMASSGLSYESFRQYSAFEAISAARNVAREVAEKSRRCVTQKDC